MRKFKMLLGMVILFELLLNVSVKAEVYKASLAILPVAAESSEKGILVDLVKMWAKETGNEIEIKLYPFKRSMKNVEKGVADFHLPMIRNPYMDENKLDFTFSTSTIFYVNFVLYTNKNKPVDRNKLANYKIATDAAHEEFFNFPVESDFRIENSLNKLHAGRIDGYIFADVEADPVLKQLGFTNIKRELYKVYEAHAVLPKGERKNTVDAMITDAMDKVKKSGAWAKLMSPVYHEYVDWQP